LISLRELEKRKKVNSYLFGGGSQTSRAEELGRSRQVIARTLRRLRDSCYDDLEIARIFMPDWDEDAPNGGVIVFDAFRPPGDTNFVYAAFDFRTVDCVCHMRGGTEENEDGWLKFFRRFDHLGYTPKLIVSDAGPMNCLLRAVARHYPGVPHQLDWEHVMREIENIMPPPPRDEKEARRRKRKDYQNESEQQLYAMIVKLRHAQDEEVFNSIWSKIRQLYLTQTQRGRQVIDLLRSDSSWLRARYRTGKDVESSNVAEYSFSRFNQLFASRMKGVHVSSTNEPHKIYNVLWAAFRVKPMENSTHQSKRGKATLELAKATVKRNDIWQFCPRSR